MRVTNLTSPRTGAKVANQFVIDDKGVEYFQSYDTVIARWKPYYLEVTDDYNYSNTTSKYFRQWLRDLGYNDSDIDKLKKLLAKSDIDTEIEWILDNGMKNVVYYHNNDYNL